MNKLTLTGVFASFGVLFIFVPSLAEPPTPSATPMSDAEFEKAQRDMNRLAGELLSVRTDTSAPSLDDRITISKRQWQIMQAKLNLLTLPSDGLRLQFNPWGNPGIDPNAALAGNYGFWFWNFTRNDTDKTTLVVDTLWALNAITNALPEMHVNAHCFVVAMLGRDGNLARRYVTFDSNEFGDLMPPHISTSPPRMSATRRQEIASMFKARASLRKQVDACIESMSQITDRDEFIDRNEKCEELKEQYQLVDGQIPGTGGLYVLLKDAMAGKQVAQTSHRRAMDSTSEERHETDAVRRARRVADFLAGIDEEILPAAGRTYRVFNGCADACDREALCTVRCMNRADSILLANLLRREHRDERSQGVEQ